MSIQFKRKYNLKVFDVDGLEIFSTSELQITFEIQKGLASIANKGKIVVYNLSNETRQRIREPFNFVTLEAGYENLIGTIFTGDIKTIASGFSGETRTVEAIREGTEVKTLIDAGDGVRALQFGSAALTLEGGLPLSEVIKVVAATMPALKVGQLSGLEGKTLAGRGLSLSGSSRMLLDALGRSYNFSWSIQDGILETVAVQEDAEGNIIADSGPQAYLLSPTTGMLGAPELMDSGKIKVKALLNPRIKPGRAISVQGTITGSGFYKVLDVTYNGDYRGNDWFVNIEGIPLGSTIGF